MTDCNRIERTNEIPIEITITPSQSFHSVGDFLDLDGLCGGKAACGKCRVKVIKPSDPAVSIDDRRHLREEEIREGIRLACRLVPGRYTVIKVPDQISPFLLDTEKLIDRRFRPGRSGPGLAIDIGTTTVMGAIFDEDGFPGITAVTDNLQTRYGLDIIDRLAAVHVHGLKEELKTAIHRSIKSVINKLESVSPNAGFDWTVAVGNSAMYHLALGLDVSSLAEYPFIPADNSGSSVIEVTTERNRYTLDFIAPLGGFVGSDAIAAYCTARRFSPYSTWLVVDLGSNCEVILHHQSGILYTSAAAGPAFEGFNLSCGMKAGNGAICHVDSSRSGFHCTVGGNTDPVGICGTGYIDFISEIVEMAVVDRTGLIRAERTGEMRRLYPTDSSDVYVTQRDIREIQKAKSAVALGIRAVLEYAGLDLSQLEALYIAGSFGRDLRIENAQKIGLIPTLNPDRCFAAGNLALLGAGFADDAESVSDVRATARRISDLTDFYKDSQYIESFRFEPWSI